MISIVIATLDDEAALAATLAALVPAVVEGVVREAIVVDGGSADRTPEIAEAAGCEWLARPGRPAGARRLAGVRAARSDWALVLPPGAVMPPDWTRAAVRHISREAGHPPDTARPAVFGVEGRGLAGLLARGFARPRVEAGLLVSLPAVEARLGGGEEVFTRAMVRGATRLTPRIASIRDA